MAHPSITQLSVVLVCITGLAGLTRGAYLESVPSLPTGQAFNTSIFTAAAGARVIYVSTTGVDSRTGLTPALAVRSLGQAWRMIPQGRTTRPWHIRILPGTYSDAQVPSYWEARWGSKQAPIWITAHAGAGTVTLNANINMYNTSWIMFSNLTMRSPFDVFHCERCNMLVLQSMIIQGDRAQGTWETSKFNQCIGVYIQDCDISGANDNAIDFVAVQYSHVIRTKIHNANWCMYIKGGSAYGVVDSCRVYTCGEGGLHAGQGTGLQFMESPWVTYEAYDVRFTNNLIYDVWGAGLGVMGGANILAAYNTLYRVGQRSHMVEITFGGRSCDGEPGTTPPECKAVRVKGGWGPISTDESYSIPCRSVYLINNVMWNPDGYRAQWQFLQVDTAQVTVNTPYMTSPVTVDYNLVIAGNVMYNGGTDTSVGLSEDPDNTLAACRPTNPTCSMKQILRDNAVLTSPQPSPLRNPAQGDFTPKSPSVLVTYGKAVTMLPAFGPWQYTTGTGVAIPAGSVVNAVTWDAAGRPRPAGGGLPGAYRGVNK